MPLAKSRRTSNNSNITQSQPEIVADAVFEGLLSELVAANAEVCHYEFLTVSAAICPTCHLKYFPFWCTFRAMRGSCNSAFKQQQASCDIHGTHASQIVNSTQQFPCPHCQRMMPTQRFAQHLEKCMGFSTTRGNRQSQALSQQQYQQPPQRTLLFDFRLKMMNDRTDERAKQQQEGVVMQSAQQVELDSLSNKRIAVDASIWLYQAVKVMARNEQIGPQHHIVVFLKRILKLLNYNVRPVFVFDGAEIPEVKRAVLQQRRERERSGTDRQRQVLADLVSVRLKQRALQQVQQEAAGETQAVVVEEPDDKIGEQDEEQPETVDHDRVLQAFKSHATDQLTAKELASIDIDSRQFQSLSAEHQVQILQEMRTRTKTRSATEWSAMQDAAEMAPHSTDFSRMQIKNLIGRSKLSRKLDTLQNRNPTAGVTKQRIVSEYNREYILVKNADSATWSLKVDADGDVNVVVDDTRPVAAANVQQQSNFLQFADEMSMNDRKTVIKQTMGAQDRKLSMYQLWMMAMPMDADEEHENLLHAALFDWTLQQVENKLAQMRNDTGVVNKFIIQCLEQAVPLLESATTRVSEQTVLQQQHEQPSAALQRIIDNQKVFDIMQYESISDNEDDDQLPSLDVIAQIEQNSPSVAKLNVVGGKRRRQEQDNNANDVDDEIIELRSAQFDAVSPVKRKGTTALKQPAPTRPVMPKYLNTELPNTSLLSTPLPKKAHVQPVPVTEPNVLTYEQLTDDEDLYSNLSSDDTLITQSTLQTPVKSTPAKSLPVKILEVESDSDVEMTKIVLSPFSKNYKAKHPTPARKTPAKNQSTPQPAVTPTHYDRHIEKLRQERDKAGQSAATVTNDMVVEVQELLRLFGIPFVVAPCEAEAQCVELQRLKLIDGIASDDSDVLVCGGTNVYRNLFTQSKSIEMYKSANIERNLCLTRSRMIMLAYLLGCDYFEGVHGCGKVLAMEIISELGEQPDAAVAMRKLYQLCKDVATGETMSEDLPYSSQFVRQLKKAAKRLQFPHDFPDVRVQDAYVSPVVSHDSAPFEWNEPDIVQLRTYLGTKLHWPVDKINQLIQPVIKSRELRRNMTQTTLDSWLVSGPSRNSSGKKATRMQQALSKLKQASEMQLKKQ